jgi:hypothetical protein
MVACRLGTLGTHPVHLMCIDKLLDECRKTIRTVSCSSLSVRSLCRVDYPYVSTSTQASLHCPLLCPSYSYHPNPS